MSKRAKLACLLAMAGLLVYRNAMSTSATAAEAASQEFIVNSGLNTDGTADSEGVIESSVTFLAAVPMQKILDNMFKAETLSKISPEHVSISKVEKTGEDDAAISYAVEEKITPFNVPFVT